MVRTIMGAADFAHLTGRGKGGAACELDDAFDIEDTPAPKRKPLVSGASSRAVTALP